MLVSRGLRDAGYSESEISSSQLLNQDKKDPLLASVRRQEVVEQPVSDDPLERLRQEQQAQLDETLRNQQIQEIEAAMLNQSDTN